MYAETIALVLMPPIIGTRVPGGRLPVLHGHDCSLKLICNRSVGIYENFTRGDAEEEQTRRKKIKFSKYNFAALREKKREGKTTEDTEGKER